MDLRGADRGVATLERRSRDLESVPDTIGPWRVTGELGRGGMGRVLRVERDAAHNVAHGDANQEGRERAAEREHDVPRLSPPGRR